ncbi:MULTISPECIES: hypothetical protein [unclassified Cyanobium]|uniref:hypothetical protein n=1 Tax=unclassified Cyanobium TaxID=2627006 RepID=UPI0020CF493A|nr:MULTISPECIES: hypothetical protein [unclassified Cyanobium]MCP9859154.1 hypothetical protein [Cyanobium sp. Cruz-8H5]MCP9866453.1 hypothetical protein [Cyanobium sp. Cruz-8D1]
MEGGHTIHFEPAVDLDPARADFVLAHPVLAALYRHRGDLVLHANTLHWRYGLIAISGSSGAGKSTTAAGLIQRGAIQIADDLTVLRAGDHGQLVVRHGAPQLHLTRVAAERLGLIHGARPSPVRSDKVVVPLDGPTASPLPHAAAEPGGWPDPSGPGLRDLVLLEPGDGPQVQLRRLRGADLFLALQHGLYGPLKPCDTPASFRLQALLARSVRVWSLKRPQGRWCLDAVLDTLEQALAAAPAPLGEDPPASAEPRLPPAHG